MSWWFNMPMVHKTFTLKRSICCVCCGDLHKLSLWKLQMWWSLVMLGCTWAPKGIRPLVCNEGTAHSKVLTLAIMDWFLPLQFHIPVSISLEQGKSEGFNSCDRPSSNLKLDSNRPFFSPCDLEIWWMTLKNNRALLLCYIKLCASFQSHGWIQTWVPVRKRSIRVKIGNFLSCVTLKFDRWPWKSIGHLSYTTSSFVCHFIAIGKVNLENQ